MFLKVSSCCQTRFQRLALGYAKYDDYYFSGSTMKTRRFIQCDVFRPVPLHGNGLAVVVDSERHRDFAYRRLFGRDSSADG
jgi:hypothetical protein